MWKYTIRERRDIQYEFSTNTTTTTIYTTITTTIGITTATTTIRLLVRRLIHSYYVLYCSKSSTIISQVMTIDLLGDVP